MPDQVNLPPKVTSSDSGVPNEQPKVTKKWYHSFSVALSNKLGYVASKINTLIDFISPGKSKEPASLKGRASGESGSSINSERGADSETAIMSKLYEVGDSAPMPNLDKKPRVLSDKPPERPSTPDGSRISLEGDETLYRALPQSGAPTNSGRTNVSSLDDLVYGDLTSLNDDELVKRLEDAEKEDFRDIPRASSSQEAALDDLLSWPALPSDEKKAEARSEVEKQEEELRAAQRELENDQLDEHLEDMDADAEARNTQWTDADIEKFIKGDHLKPPDSELPKDK